MISEPTRLRSADVADAEAIARIQLLGYTVGAADLLPADYLAELDDAELTDEWRTRLGLPNASTRTIVAVNSGPKVAGASAVDGGAVEGGVVVGFASYVRSFDPGTPYDGPNEYAELTLLYVDPDRWSQGVGGLLHDAVLDAMRAEGYHTARLWVLPGNERALRFYRRRGWTDDHLRRDEPDHGFTLAYQRYRLPLSERRNLRVSSH